LRCEKHEVGVIGSFLWGVTMGYTQDAPALHGAADNMGEIPEGAHEGHRVMVMGACGEDTGRAVLRWHGKGEVLCRY